MTQPNQKITLEIKEQIIALRKQGVSYRAIKEKMPVQISFQRIAQIVSEENIENSPHIMEQKKNIVLQMYNDNFSIKYIAKTIGVSQGIVQYWLNKWQVPRRQLSNNYPSDRPTPKIRKYKEKIITMYRKNVTLSDIAKEVGLTLTTVSNALYKWGISSRRRIISDTQKTEILNAIAQGKTKTEIAKSFNISLSTVYNLLRKS